MSEVVSEYFYIQSVLSHHDISTDIIMIRKSMPESKNKAKSKLSRFKPREEPHSFGDILVRNIMDSNLSSEDKRTILRIVNRDAVQHGRKEYDFNGIQTDHIGSRDDNILDEVSRSIRRLIDEIPEGSMDIGVMKYLSKIEDLVLTCIILFRNKDDMYTIASVLLLYIKTHLDNKSICSIFRSTSEQNEVDQMGSYGLNEFKLFMTSDFVKHGRFIMNLLVTLNCVSPTQWSIGKFNLFNAQAIEHDDGCTLLEQLFGSIKFFFTVGYECFRENSIYPFLTSFGYDSELETKMNKIQIDTTSFLNGSGDELEVDVISALDEVIRELQDRLKYSRMQDKTQYSKRLSQMMQLHDRVIRTVSSRGLRLAPYCLKIYGKSSVGKTAVNNFSISEILQYNKQRVEITRIQPELPFWENYTSSTTGIILDDMCNTVHTKTKVSPSEIIISLMGNYPFAVNRAAIEDKCQVYVNAHVVGITTNNEMLDAHHFSVEPMSVLRRCHVHVTVRVKPCYATKEGQIDTHKTQQIDGNGLIKDIWLFDLRRATTQDNKQGVVLEPIVFQGKQMMNIDVYQYLEYLYYDSSRHYAEQKKLLDDACNFKRDCCTTCNKIVQMCQCCEDQMGFGYMATVLGTHVVNTTTKELTKATHSLSNTLYDMVCPSWSEKMILGGVSRAISLRKRFCEDWTVSLARSIMGKAKKNLHWLPNCVLNSFFFRQWYDSVDARCAGHFDKHLHRLSCYGMLGGFGGSLFSFKKRHYQCLGFSSGLFGMSFTMWASSRYLRSKRIASEIQDLVERHNASPQFLRAEERVIDVVTGVVGASAIAISVLAVVEVARRLLENFTSKVIEVSPNDTQGNILSPQTVEEVNERNTAYNPWKLDFSEVSHNDNRTPKQLLNTVAPNQVYIEVYDSDGTFVGFMNGLFLCSRLCMMPAHAFMGKDQHGERSIWKEGVFLSIVRSSNVNHKARVWVSKEDLYQIPDADCVAFPIDCCGTFKDISKLFPKLSKYSGPYLSQWRDARGDFVQKYGTIVSTTQLKYERGSLKYDYHGCYYLGKDDFRNGDCFSLLVTDSGNPHIISLHLRGWIDNRKQGSGISLNYDDVITIKQHFDRKFVEHSSNNQTFTMYGKDLGVVKTIHEKSPINFLEEVNCDPIGSLGSSVTMKSAVRDSLLVPLLEPVFGKQKWGPPKFKGQGNQPWKPWYDSLQFLAKPGCNVDRKLLRRAREDYISDLKGKLFLHAQNVRPLTWDETVNGIPNSRFISRINLNTAMGFPLHGKKRNHMYIREKQGDNLIFDFTDDMIKKEHDRIVENYRQNSLANFVFKASLKDEPTKLTKDKVRVFQAMPVGAQMVVRSKFLPVLSFLSLEPLVSECAVGINPFGKEWDALHHHITKYGTNRIVAGDYSKWDLRLPAALVMEAFDIMIELARETGNYSEDDIKVMYGIAFDISNPLVHYNGTLVRFHGSNPSGQNLTAHLNSICNALVQRMAFYSVNPQNRRFRDYVASMTYGDDLCSSTTADSNYDHFVLRDYCKKGLDIVLTMPNKEDEATQFMDMESVDFLKRKSTFNKDLGVYVGVLDINSIHKSLYCTMAKKSMERVVLVATMESAIHELFFHGREVYDYYISLFSEWSDALGISVPQVSIGYDDRVRDWHSKYNNSKKRNHLFCLDDAEQELTLSEQIDTFEGEDLDEPSVSDCDEFNNLGDFKHSPLANFKGENSSYDSSENRAFSTPSTDQSGERIEPEMSMSSVIKFSTPTTQNIHVETSMDETFYMTTYPGGQNQDVLKRPLEIRTIPWEVNTSVPDVKFDPFWAMVDSSQLVRDRLSYYGYISGTMCIKVLVNGSPFHYGKSILCVRPWPEITGSNALSPQQKTSLPYISINPTDATGGQVTIPLMHPLGKTSLFKREKVLECELSSLQVLRSVNETLDPVTISIWVWFLDYELHMPTFAELNVDQMSDEYEKPLVSTAATAASNFVGTFRKWPVIGWYARASEVVFDATAKIAQLYGFSKPSIIQQEQHVQDMALGNLANFNNKDSCVKLALDCKNEVTIDPNVTGYKTQDDMILSEIASKEAFLTTFQWDPADAPRSIIWNAAVNPSVCPVGSEFYLGSFYERPDLTPVGHLSLPFKYWRGTLRYRFEIVASQFHKGKFRVAYEPFKPPNSTMGIQDNVLYSRIVDIATEKNIVMDIGWANPQNYLEVWTPSSVETVLGRELSIQESYKTWNGYLFVTVVNPITCTTAESISINVYISAGPDFELQEPCTKAIDNFSTVIFDYEASTNNAWVPNPSVDQMGCCLSICDEPPDFDLTDCSEDQMAEPVNLSADNIADGSHIDPLPIFNEEPDLNVTERLALIHFGERVVSLRQLLKRYCTHSYIVPFKSEAGSIQSCNLTIQLNDFPYYIGKVDTFPTTAFGDEGWNLCSTSNFLNWYTPCFLMRRGSLRNKFIMLNDGDPQSYFPYDLYAYRSPDTGTFLNKQTIANEGNDDWLYTKTLLVSDTEHGAQGASVIGTPHRNGVEIECPFYSPKRWFFGHDLVINEAWSDAFFNPSALLRQQTFFRLVLKYLQQVPGGGIPELETSSHLVLRRYTAAGDDFSLQFYMCPPTVIRYNIANTPL